MKARITALTLAACLVGTAPASADSKLTIPEAKRVIRHSWVHPDHLRIFRCSRIAHQRVRCHETERVRECVSIDGSPAGCQVGEYFGVEVVTPRLRIVYEGAYVTLDPSA